MRPEGGKIGDGQTQCFAKLDKLSYDNYKYYDGEVEVDSDDSDYSTDSSAGEEDVDVQIVKQKTKWKCKSSVKFYTDESASTQVAELKVKAKGKAKQKDTLIRTEMEDGSVEESHEFEQKTKVKKFFYKLEMADGTEVPVTLDGNWNKVSSTPGSPRCRPQLIPVAVQGDAQLQWNSTCFQAVVGKFGEVPTVKIEAGAHPTLWLLIGFCAAQRLSPDDVKRNCNPPFFGVSSTTNPVAD